MNNTRQQTKKKNQVTWMNWVCISYLGLVVGCALFAHWLPLGYSPNEQDLLQIYQEPFRWELYQTAEPFHLLGADDLGRDVGVNLVYGARTALLVSVPTIILAACLGITMGMLAGYFGNSGLKLSAGKLLALLVAGFFLFFYFFIATLPEPEPGSNSILILFRISIAFMGFGIYKSGNYLFNKFSFFRQPIRLPLDLTVLKLIELIGSVPRLLLILSLAAFAPQASLKNVILLSILTFWPGIARLTRAEILKIKHLPYVEAAVALGFHPLRVVLRHALPNMLVPLLVAITFGLCNLIALEATLSFLGVGIPDDMPSWGRSINKIRENFQAWWLVLFPGLAILFTVLSLQNMNTLLIKWVQPQNS